MSCDLKVRKSFWEAHTLRTRVFACERFRVRAFVRTCVCASARFRVFSRLSARVLVCRASGRVFGRLYASMRVSTRRVAGGAASEK